MMRKLMLMLALLVIVSSGRLEAQSVEFTVRAIPLDSVGYEIALAPDGRTLAVWDNMILLGQDFAPDYLPIRLFDLDSGEQIGALEGASDHAVSAAFSPDGTRLVSHHQNGDVNLWDVEAQSLLRRLITFTPTRGGQVRFLPDGTTVAVQLNGPITQFALLDINSGSIAALIAPRFERFEDFEAQSGGLDRMSWLYSTFAVSPSGDALLAANGSGALDLWALLDGEPVRLKEEDEEKGRLNIRAIAFDSSSETFVYFDATDEGLHVWSIDGEELQVLPFGAQNFALAPNGKQVVWISRDDFVLWLAEFADPQNPIELIRLDRPLAFAPLPQVLAYSSDGARLVLGGIFNNEGDNVIYIVDFE